MNQIMRGAILPGLAQALRKRLAPKRTDALGREQGQAMLRVTISLIVFVYLTLSHWPLDDDFSSGIPGWFGFLAIFITWSTLIALHARRDNDSRLWRRTATNAGDIAAISYLMINTHEAGIPLFVLYLWVTLGNGFRFGVRSLAISTILSLGGFSVVHALSPVWRELPMVSVAVLLALLIVPLYASHLIRQLSAALKYAEEANAAKSAFVARMSHEMRTPLNGILGTASLLLNSKRLNPEERSLLGVIEESVNVSLRQITNILDFSKLEAGKLVLEHTPFDLHELLTNTARLLRASAHEKGVRLMVRIAPATPHALVGDPHHLREMLLNLLSNAIKFTDRGYVTLEAVALREDQHSALLRLEVRDTGIGIAPDALARIFDSFVQEDASTTRRYGGTGLGTTIAKQLVELMHGRIGVDSVKGQGSTFWAEIPFERQRDAPALPAALVGIRALVITDDSGIREHWRNALTAVGGSVVFVASPAEAVDALGRSIRFGNPYHMVFADRTAVVSPSGTHRGADLLGKAYMARLSVVMLSATFDAAQLREWGYSAHLPPTASLDLIHNLLRQSEGYRDDHPRGVIRVEPWAWQGRRARGIRVLAADDNRTNLLILTKILNGAHYEVETAADGETALEKLLSGFYRVAILDMHMPGLDGPDVVRQYRHMRPRSRLQIVMLTANATAEAQLECADAGADAYLTKPATPDAVLDTLERVLAESNISNVDETFAPVKVSSPILQRDIISALSLAMGGDAQALRDIADTFFAEGRELLAAIETAARSRNHPVFSDRARALQSHAAYVGARRLAEACDRAAKADFAAFHTSRHELCQQLNGEFSDAIAALREIIGEDHPGHHLGH